MANSSATRTGGLYSASELPMTTMAVRSVRRTKAAAIKLGDGTIPYAD